MNRYIIKYQNGKIRQQRGINTTYYYLIGVGVISWIIDTKEGTVMFGDKDEQVYTEKIAEYDDSTLVSEIKKEEK